MRVKELIKEKGYTQQEIADKLGIFLQSLNNTLNNDTIPIKKLRAIAEIIGCQVGDFFKDEMTNDGYKIVCPHCGREISLTVEVR